MAWARGTLHVGRLIGRPVAACYYYLPAGIFNPRIRKVYLNNRVLIFQTALTYDLLTSAQNGTQHFLHQKEACSLFILRKVLVSLTASAIA